MKNLSIQGILLGAAIAVLLSAAIPGGSPAPKSHEVSFAVEVYEDGSVEAVVTAPPETPVADVAVWWGDSPDGDTAVEIEKGVWVVPLPAGATGPCFLATAEVVIEKQHKYSKGKKKAKSKKKGKGKSKSKRSSHVASGEVFLTLTASGCVPPEDCPEPEPMDCPEIPPAQGCPEPQVINRCDVMF